MKVQFTENALVVTRESTDPKFFGTGGACGESRFLYHLKLVLNKMGFDLIKKRMWKDGHGVDDMQQYLRTRKPTGNPKNDIYVYNTQWAIDGLNDRFNRGEVVCGVMRNVFAAD